VKSAALAGLFFVVGICLGVSVHPLLVHAQQPKAEQLAPARVIEVNLKDGGLVYERLEVTAVGLSCFEAPGGPKCYVLVKGN